MGFKSAPPTQNGGIHGVDRTKHIRIFHAQGKGSVTPHGMAGNPTTARTRQGAITTVHMGHQFLDGKIGVVTRNRGVGVEAAEETGFLIRHDHQHPFMKTQRDASVQYILQTLPGPGITGPSCIRITNAVEKV